MVFAVKPRPKVNRPIMCKARFVVASSVSFAKNDRDSLFTVNPGFFVCYLTAFLLMENAMIITSVTYNLTKTLCSFILRQQNKNQTSVVHVEFTEMLYYCNSVCFTSRNPSLRHCPNRRCHNRCPSRNPSRHYHCCLKNGNCHNSQNLQNYYSLH